MRLKIRFDEKSKKICKFFELNESQYDNFLFFFHVETNKRVGTRIEAP